MAIYFRSANEVPPNGRHAGIAKDSFKNIEDDQIPASETSDQNGQAHGFKKWIQAAGYLQGYSLPLAFFAGLIIGCVASNTSKKERDVYNELAPATDISYKMKTTLLKANLLLQGMDSVIENASKNFYLKEVK